MHGGVVLYALGVFQKKLILHFSPKTIWFFTFNSKVFIFSYLTLQLIYFQLWFKSFHLFQFNPTTYLLSTLIPYTFPFRPNLFALSWHNFNVGGRWYWSSLSRFYAPTATRGGLLQRACRIQHFFRIFFPVWLADAMHLFFPFNRFVATRGLRSA